jgi:PD-(D/E)XK endonuclease
LDHRTKTKGDLAVAKTIVDLTSKGYSVLTPVACEHLPFDLVAYKDKRLYRIQVKYNSDGFVSKKTSWSSKKGNHYKNYEPDDFDYYALYLPDLDVVLYPSISFRGHCITMKVPLSTTPFYWWEDFKEFTLIATKRTYKEFNVDLRKRKVNPNAGLNRRKVERPSKEKLAELVLQMSLTEIGKKYGVSGNAVKKWCNSYGVKLPTKEYWARAAYVMSQFDM